VIDGADQSPIRSGLIDRFAQSMSFACGLEGLKILKATNKLTHEALTSIV